MEDDKKIFDADSMSDQVFANTVKRRYEEASGHWESKYNLKSVRSKNNRDYLAKYVDEQLIDERYEEVYVDNRQFTSVRTIVPFLTARITQPEVTPVNGDDLSLQFAKDFEEALQRHAVKQMARAKVRLAVQDVLRGERVGVLKWRYDAFLDTVILERCKPNSITIGKRSSQFEEPDFVRHTQKRSVGDLVKQFPEKKDKIYELFGIDKGTPSQLEREYKINEDWIWVDLEEEKTLVVGWTYQNFCFGKMKDPNWNYKGKNVADKSMVPFIFINFLNDGEGYLDQTSFMEQARWLQSNYNKRGQTIAESAKYGGTGVPIFAKGSISQKDVAKIHFSPIQRVLLDTPDVSKSFTTWQATPLPQFIVEDKYDDRNSIDNIWGTPNIFRGEQSKNNTLGQDVIVRDQAEGRQSDPVDCIDDAMERFYIIEAQMMYRYFTEDKFYNYLGNDGKFVSIVVSKPRIAKNIGIEIGVNAGTSLPIDRAQKRATIMELLKLNKVGTLTAYKELGVFEDPEEAFKDYVMEQLDPKAMLDETDKRVFDREANEDLQLVIGGKVPDERDELPETYLNFLNEYLLSDKYKFLTADEQARVSEFIDAVLQKASRQMNKLALQPSPDPLGQPPVDPNADPNAQQPGQPPVPPQMSQAMPSAPQMVQ